MLRQAALQSSVSPPRGDGSSLLAGCRDVGLTCGTGRCPSACVLCSGRAVAPPSANASRMAWRRLISRLRCAPEQYRLLIRRRVLKGACRTLASLPCRPGACRRDSSSAHLTFASAEEGDEGAPDDDFDGGWQPAMHTSAEVISWTRRRSCWWAKRTKEGARRGAIGLEHSPMMSGPRRGLHGRGISGKGRPRHEAKRHSAPRVSAPSSDSPVSSRLCAHSLHEVDILEAELDKTALPATARHLPAMRSPALGQVPRPAVPHGEDAPHGCQRPHPYQPRPQ